MKQISMCLSLEAQFVYHGGGGFAIEFTLLFQLLSQWWGNPAISNIE
jgi:Flp pilus assembly protein TadG